MGNGGVGKRSRKVTPVDNNRSHATNADAGVIVTPAGLRPARSPTTTESTRAGEPLAKETTSTPPRTYTRDDVVPFEEDERHEFKRCSEVFSKHVWAPGGDVIKNVVGFLNSPTGGTLYLGIDDNGAVVGTSLSRSERDKFRLAVNRMLRFVTPSVLPSLVSITFVPVVGNPHEGHHPLGAAAASSSEHEQPTSVNHAASLAVPDYKTWRNMRHTGETNKQKRKVYLATYGHLLKQNGNHTDTHVGSGSPAASPSSPTSMLDESPANSPPREKHLSVDSTNAVNKADASIPMSPQEQHRSIREGALEDVLAESTGYRDPDVQSRLAVRTIVEPVSRHSDVGTLDSSSRVGGSVGPVDVTPPQKPNTYVDEQTPTPAAMMDSSCDVGKDTRITRTESLPSLGNGVDTNLGVSDCDVVRIIPSRSRTIGDTSVHGHDVDAVVDRASNRRSAVKSDNGAHGPKGNNDNEDNDGVVDGNDDMPGVAAGGMGIRAAASMPEQRHAGSRRDRERCARCDRAGHSAEKCWKERHRVTGSLLDPATAATAKGTSTSSPIGPGKANSTATPRRVVEPVVVEISVRPGLSLAQPIPYETGEHVAFCRRAGETGPLTGTERFQLTEMVLHGRFGPHNHVGRVRRSNDKRKSRSRLCTLM